MGNFIVSLLGIILAFFMMKYRERIGDTLGEAVWMQKIGGVYNLVIIVAVFIFFFSLAKMTGTTEIFLDPFISWIPGLKPEPVPSF